MRKLGIAALGFFGGLMTGLIVNEILGVILFGLGMQTLDSPLLIIPLRLLAPVLALLGVPLALAIDGRKARPGGAA